MKIVTTDKLHLTPNEFIRFLDRPQENEVSPIESQAHDMQRQITCNGRSKPAMLGSTIATISLALPDQMLGLVFWERMP